MMAHVAEAAEARGRVLMWLEPGSRAAHATMLGAVKIAHAFRSEIETLVVDDGAFDRLHELDAARAVTAADAEAPAMAKTIITRAVAQFDLAAARDTRAIQDIARTFGVSCRHASATGDPVDTLSTLCTERGPWNIIALTARPSQQTAATIANLFANVSGVTAVLAGGIDGDTQDGPVAVIAEDGERVPSMLRAADRLTGITRKTHIFIAATSPSARANLDGDVRLLAAGHASAVFETTAMGADIEGAFDERLRKLRPSLVIARFGGAFLPSARAVARTLTLARAPFLLVR